MPQNQSKQNTVPFFSRLVATGFFSGYSPIIPGTAGSLVGVALYFIPGMENNLTLAIVTIIIFILGTVTSAQVERQFGEDPQIVVIDEIVGMWVSLIAFPKTLWIILLAFFFFRLYDIVKPPPARQLEHLKHGLGIMLDDIAAGIYANITVRILLLIFPGIG
jgi:phosphatidylglycerophosphatase A